MPACNPDCDSSVLSATAASTAYSDPAKKNRLSGTSRDVALPSRNVDGDNTVRSADAGFLSYRFENSKWNKRAVFLPEQPSAGFTVLRCRIPTKCGAFAASTSIR